MPIAMADTSLVDYKAKEEARRWLAEQGVAQVSDGVWTSDEGSGDELLTANDVAHAWTRALLEDPDLDSEARLRLALGLLDLLDDYWVTCEIRFTMADAYDPNAGLLWDAYRRRLEAPEPADPITYSLWVDWFEEGTTVEIAFAEVLGNDVARLLIQGRFQDTADNPLLRRAQRVLEVSGPVPWPIKHPVYQACVALPALHLALFRGLLGSYHDVYGRLEPHAAYALLQQLDLSFDTKFLAQLRTVLKAGHTNHRRSPDAWPATDQQTF
ncbi:hypothetical protein ACFHYQ_23885 [Sphaerimonospora cavernae]|uniref:Uncharacterized protein n=1 Tax=Sphaerimonospora cavernae TaxID=1740611 RepID=A0ABV6UAX4_9ACTN